MTNSTHARVAAAGLVLGPLLFTIGDLLRRLVDSGATSATAITHAVGQHDGLWLGAGLLDVGGAFLFIPGVVGLIAAANGRGARITTVGAVVLGVGVMASVGHAVAYYATYALYARADTPAPELKALESAGGTYPLLGFVIALFIIGMMVGPIVLLVGLRLARRVPIWSVVAAVAFVVLAETGGVGAGVVLILAALATFVPAARSLLTTGDSTPQPEPAIAVGVGVAHG